MERLAMAQNRINRISFRVCCVWAATVSIALNAVGAEGYFKNGFKVGPNYKRPVAPIAPAWIEGSNPRVNGGGPEALWWTSFNDPVLTSLIGTASNQNLTVRAAGMRILQARAQREFATGNLLPQQQSAYGAYTRVGQTQAIANRNPTGRQRFFNDWLFGGQFIWELDFWGRFRRAVTAADARLDAEVEDYDDVLLILVSDVATTYVEIRTLDQRLIFAKRNQAIQSESVRLADLKVEAGTRESELDLPQAKSNLAEIEALIPQLELQRRQAMNRLSVLLGMPPADLTNVIGPGNIPLPPPEIAVGIPADIIRRRPDVRRSERELAAQSEEIGIAVADLYPHLSISGTIFFESERFGDLFTHQAWGGAVGPSFRWDILNYGRLRANIRREEARFGELLYNYQQTVLRANEEAENALALYLYSHQITESLKKGADASVEGVRIASTRYQDGVTDFNRLSNMQLFVARQQDQLAVARGQIAQGWIDVYRSLGGGWQIRLVGPEGPTGSTPLAQPETVVTPPPADAPPAPPEVPPAPPAEPPAPPEVPPTPPEEPVTLQPGTLLNPAREATSLPIASDVQPPPQSAPPLSAPTLPVPTLPVPSVEAVEIAETPAPPAAPPIVVAEPAVAEPMPLNLSYPTTMQPQTIAAAPLTRAPLADADYGDVPAAPIELPQSAAANARIRLPDPRPAKPIVPPAPPSAEELLIVLSHPDSLRIQRSTKPLVAKNHSAPRQPASVDPMEPTPVEARNAGDIQPIPVDDAPELSYPATMLPEPARESMSIDLSQPASIKR
jgi:NodT family efflux transporter outer membrane factor (OMF) lipoprotein